MATAVIGTGKVAHVHAQALASLPESRLVAVFGRDQASARTFADQYGVTPFWDLRSMLDAGQVEAVTVCTPHPTHADIAVACAEAGIHLLVEKPLAIDLEGADRAIEATDRANVRLGVISQRRFYPPVVRMKDAIDHGKIGRPVLGVVLVLGWRDESYYRLGSWRGTWKGEGGGVLVNQAVHQLDLLQWFMGPASEVTGFWANLNHPSIEVEDTAVASIRFANGGLGAIVASNAQRPGLYAKVHVHGENGASVGVQTDEGSMFATGETVTIEPAINDLWTVPGEEHLLAEWQAKDRAAAAGIDIATHFHRLQISDFLRAILENRQPAVTGVDGRRAVELFSAIYRSQAEHRAIRVGA